MTGYPLNFNIYRVKKLVDAGVISKFTVLLDPRKIGYPTTGILMVKIAPEQFSMASKVFWVFAGWEDPGAGVLFFDGRREAGRRYRDRK